MANFRVSWIFRSPTGGWSESFYDDAASLEAYPTPTVNARTRFVDWRARGVVAQALKVTEEGGLRRSRIIPLNWEGAAGGAFGLGISNEERGVVTPGDSIKTRLSFSGGGGRTLELRGAPDAALFGSLTTGGSLSPAMQGKFDDLVNWILTPSDPYLGKRLKSIADEPWKDCISLEPDPANGAWTRVNIVNTGLVLTPGTVVYFKGVDPLLLPWLRGYYRVVGQTTATTFSIPTSYREAASPTVLRNVQYRRALYDYPAIVAGSFLRIGTRDTRLPFDRVRGRSKGTPTRRSPRAGA